MSEILVVVVDVSVARYAAIVSELVMALCRNKLLYAPKDEVALVVAGSSMTENRLHLSAPHRYDGIAVVLPPTAPSATLLSSASAMKFCETGNCDFVEALLVAGDIIVGRHPPKSMAKRVLMFTAGIGKVREKGDAVTVCEAFAAHGIELVVCGLGFSQTIGDTSSFEPCDWESMSVGHQGEVVLRHICKRIGSSSLVVNESEAREAIEAPHRRKRAQRAIGRLTLYIGTLEFNVGVYTKVSREKVTPLRPQLADGTTPVRDSFSHSVLSDHPLPPDRCVWSFQYGRTVLPTTAEDVSSLRGGFGDRRIDVLAFTPRDSLPPTLAMGATYTIAPENDAGTLRAFGAVVRAMARLRQVGIARCVMRRHGEPVLWGLVPSAKNDRVVVFAVPLPFAEDVRSTSLPPSLPCGSTEDAACVAAVVEALRWEEEEEGKEKRWKSTSNVNPVWHYTHRIAIERAMKDPSAPRPPLPETLRRASCRWGEAGNVLHDLHARSRPACRALYERFAEPTTTSHVGKKWFDVGGDVKREKGKRRREEGDLEEAEARGDPHVTPQTTTSKAPAMAVSPLDPVRTFVEMVKSQEGDVVMRALSQLSVITKEILDDSIGDTAFPSVRDCLNIMREVCMEQDEAAIFNDFLSQIFHTTNHPARRRFAERFAGESCMTSIPTETSTQVDEAEPHEQVEEEAHDALYSLLE